MGKDYNLRQTKVFEDYGGFPTDKLMEMVKSEIYADEVTDVLKDILQERNGTLKISDLKNVPVHTIEEEYFNDIEKAEKRKKEIISRKKEVDFYLKQLERSSNKELAVIITKYTSYQLATVEAALIMAEKRGTISSLEKEKLLAQIEENYGEYELKEEVIAQEKTKKSSGQLNAGLILTALGALLTIGTSVHPIGGYSIVFYGFIVSGIILIYRGYFRTDQNEA